MEKDSHVTGFLIGLDMTEQIPLPEEYPCPICKNRLWLFHYKGKDAYGAPMISCHNWDGCRSPWREDPPECPWHVWIAFDGNGVLMFQRGNHEPVENLKRHEFLQALISILKDFKYDSYLAVRNFCEDWQLWRQQGNGVNRNSNTISEREFVHHDFPQKIVKLPPWLKIRINDGQWHLVEYDNDWWYLDGTRIVNEEEPEHV